MTNIAPLTVDFAADASRDSADLIEIAQLTAYHNRPHLLVTVLFQNKDFWKS